MPENLTAAQPSPPYTALEALKPSIRPSGPSVAQFTPPEVVAEIFKPLATRLEVLSSGRTRQFPWYLGQICSTWRPVFLSMHCEFWSQFCLSPDPAVPADTQVTQEMQMRCIDIARLFLERGQGKPFSFKIHGGSPSSRLLDGFMEESERWLDVQCVIYASEIRSLSARTLVLSAIGLNCGNWNAPPECQDVFKNAPRLTRVRTHSLSKWVFNWSSFTVFELTFAFPRDNIFYALSEMKNLEKLLIDQSLPWDWPRDTDETITLPRLKVLATVGYILYLYIFQCIRTAVTCGPRLEMY